MTPQEVKLWVNLRMLRSQGFHFRRQVPRGRYVLDFACLRRRLAIEVDGGQHSRFHKVAADRLRDSMLAAQGFVVLRFWNNDIDKNIEGVMDTIIDAVSRRPPTPDLRPHPPPTLGEG